MWGVGVIILGVDVSPGLCISLMQCYTSPEIGCIHLPSPLPNMSCGGGTVHQSVFIGHHQYGMECLCLVDLPEPDTIRAA